MQAQAKRALADHEAALVNLANSLLTSARAAEQHQSRSRGHPQQQQDLLQHQQVLPQQQQQQQAALAYVPQAVSQSTAHAGRTTTASAAGLEMGPASAGPPENAKEGRRAGGQQAQHVQQQFQGQHAQQQMHQLPQHPLHLQQQRIPQLTQLQQQQQQVPQHMQMQQQQDGGELGSYQPHALHVQEELSSGLRAEVKREGSPQDSWFGTQDCQERSQQRQMEEDQRQEEERLREQLHMQQQHQQQQQRKRQRQQEVHQQQTSLHCLPQQRQSASGPQGREPQQHERLRGSQQHLHNSMQQPAAAPQVTSQAGTPAAGWPGTPLSQADAAAAEAPGAAAPGWLGEAAAAPQGFGVRRGGFGVAGALNGGSSFSAGAAVAISNAGAAAGSDYAGLGALDVPPSAFAAARCHSQGYGNAGAAGGLQLMPPLPQDVRAASQ